MLWLGQLVNGLGRQVTVVALPFELWQLTRSSLSIGLLAIVQLVPILVFSLGGGAVADAVDRRRLLIATQALLAVSSLCLAILAIQASPPIWAFYVVAFVAAGVGAVDQPSRSSAIPRLVPRERLQAAIAVNWLSGQTVSVAGPVVAGVLIAVAGVATAFAFDVATFGASLVAVFLIAPIPPHPDAARPGLRSISEGIRFARDRRIVAPQFHSCHQLRRAFDRQLEEPGGLARNGREVGFSSRVTRGFEHELSGLTADDGGAARGKSPTERIANRRCRRHFSDREKRRKQHQVAEVDGLRFAVTDPRRRQATTHPVAVLQVVVDEGRVV